MVTTAILSSSEPRVVVALHPGCGTPTPLRIYRKPNALTSMRKAATSSEKWLPRLSDHLLELLF